MKKLIIILGMFLMSASAIADHTSGLKQHQAGHYGSNVEVSGAAIATPKAALFLNQSSARQPTIVTDPVSCIEKWGDACLELETSAAAPTPALDLGGTTVQEHLVPVEEGESIQSILDEVQPPVETSDDFVGPIQE